MPRLYPELATHYCVFKLRSDGTVGWTGEPTGPETGQPMRAAEPAPVPATPYDELYPFAAGQQRYKPVTTRTAPPNHYELSGGGQNMGSIFVSKEVARTGLKASARSPQL